ncbi:TetR/AcrR family transcriptional regulator [Edaphocola flava]|jgi:AcrR family transcriptional regulator|uniref:TetR/AcrR family transcriptional regulator n=1 Tax=Edaphocola flava TaxID=2499629 RepID=UPI001386626C|nr:TetR/AcrR family transcriptional regulator [Edaphocola flava]
METISEYEKMKQQILVAAKSVFIKYGYNKVSMDDIAKALGKSRSTLYHYFKNKKEVFELIAFTEFKQIMQLAELEVIKGKSIQDNLIDYYSKKADCANELLVAYSSLAEEIKAHEDVFYEISKMQVEAEASVLRRILEWAIEQKEINTGKERDITFLSRVLTTALRSFEQEVFLQNKFSTFKVNLSMLVEILCKGLR